jgi:hypothetical protein
MPELPRQSSGKPPWGVSVPAIGGGTVIVAPEGDHVLVLIDQGVGRDGGLMAAVEPAGALRLCQGLLEAFTEVRR